MNETIIVTIDADANVSVSVCGVVGKSCTALTADLERALGTSRDVRFKPEYERTPKIGQQAQAGH